MSTENTTFKLTTITANWSQTDWLSESEMAANLETIAQLLHVLEIGETFTLERIDTA